MNPTDFIIANQLKRSGKLEEAIAAYKKAIARNPNFSWLYSRLGEALEEASRLNEAVNAHLKSIEIDPDSAWCHYKLGLAYFQLEQYTDAVLHLEKAVKINPCGLYKNAFDHLTIKLTQPKIDFGIIGFPKCGTTSLAWNLHKHPGVCMIPKENPIQNLRKHALSLASRHPSKLIGFKTATFIYEKNAISELLEINPKMKMIVCLRDPVSWLFSFYQYRRLNVQQNSSRWVQFQLEKNPMLRTITFDKIVYEDANLLGAHKKGGCFVKYLKQLISLLPSEQVLITFLENWETSSKEEYRRTLSFLNLPQEQIDLNKVGKQNINKGNYESKELYQQQLIALNQFYLESVQELNDFLKENVAINIPTKFLNKFLKPN